METRKFEIPDDDALDALLALAYHAWQDGAERVGIHPAVLIYLMTGEKPPPIPEPHKALSA